MHKIHDSLRSFFAAIADCLALSWKTSPKYTILRLTCNIVPPILVLALSYLGKIVLDLLSGNYRTSSEVSLLLVLAALICLIKILQALIQKARAYMQSMHDELISKELALYMMGIAGSMDLEYFDNANYYDKLSTSTRDAPTIAYLLWNVLSTISAALTVISTSFLLCRMNIFYCVLIILAAVPASIASSKYTKAIYSLSIDQINGERQKSYLQGLLMSRQAAQDLRLFDVCGALKNKYHHLWESMFSKKKALSRKRSALTAVLECLPEIAVAAISIHIAMGVMNGQSTVGDYSLYTGLVAQLWSGVFLFSDAAMQIFDNHLKIANVKILSEFQNHIHDGAKALHQIDEISFEHVSFSYPGSAAPALRDVTFCVNAHEKVVLVGLNGSGKSTLIKLLLRFYDVAEGSIKINGVDIREYRIRDLRQNFSVYFQDAPAFSFPLRENITIADISQDADDQHIIHAIQASGATDILSNAPRGLDTHITRLFDNQGIELSGGQYQKLALARTLFRRHSALILDEPSSNLDPQAEHILFEQLKKFTEGKTVLFTSHRLSNVFLADRIIVMEKGAILEHGTHQELVSSGGRYAELYHYQQEHFGATKGE